MKNLVRVVFPAVALAAVAVVGCNRERVTYDRDRDRAPEDRSGTTTVTGANVGRVSNESAIERIVAARCEREAACNNVGADKRFGDRSVCTQKVRADMRDDLSANDCPRGIDAKELGECLSSIKKEDCNNPIDTIGRLAACRTSDMCLKADTPNR